MKVIIDGQEFETSEVKIVTVHGCLDVDEDYIHAHTEDADNLIEIKSIID